MTNMMPATLDQLDAWLREPEDENLELKEAKNRFDFEELVRYCVALANERGGRIVLGVTDKRPRQVVGSRAFSDLARTKAGLFERLHLRIEAEEIRHSAGRVVVFTAPSRPAGVPIQYKGAYWMRSGEMLVPMTQDRLRAIFSEGEPDFSATICKAATLDDLDPAAVERFRQMWLETSENAALGEMPVARLLEDAELVVGAQVTYAALVLLGTRKALGRHLAQSEVIFEYRSSEQKISHQQRKEYRQGFLLFHDDVWETIDLRNDLHSFQDDGFVRSSVPSFHQDAVREAILNAVAHRDFRHQGSVFVRQWPARLEVTSPGGFPADVTTENLLWRQNPRNRRIAEAFARCGLVERAGQGADRMFEACVRGGKLPPDFRKSDEHQVVVTFSGELRDPQFLRFLGRLEKKRSAFGTDDLLVLDAVHSDLPVPEELEYRLSRLLDDGVLEESTEGIILSTQFYRAFENDFKVAYHSSGNTEDFGKKVANLFQLAGYRVVVGYERDNMQFDIRLETMAGPLSVHCLVECTGRRTRINQKTVREFAGKVDNLNTTEKLPYRAVLVSRSGFTNEAHAVANDLSVELFTYEDLLRSLVDIVPCLEAGIRGFEGTPLEQLYVEQDVVLQSGIRPGRQVTASPLTGAVKQWIERDDGTFLTLLGDFGAGKTSFCRRLACELANSARDEAAGNRMPVLIDLREGGSTTVTLESLLTQHFQRLSHRPFDPRALFHLNREGYLVLFFDGFDETIGYTEPARYVENLRQVLRAAEGRAKVILTCRTHYFRDRLEEVRQLGRASDVLTTRSATRLYEEIRGRPGTEIGYLREFTEEQIDEYLQKAVQPPTDWRKLREEIRSTYNLDDLAERPFLLELIVKTLPSLAREEGADITLADLYESFCASWFDRAESHLRSTRDYKVALVEYLARLLWNENEQKVHYQTLFERSTELAAGQQQLTPHDKDQIDFEVRTALFLHRDPEGHYRFIHRSFLEFFVARTLRAGLANLDSACLDLRPLSREVVFFLGFWPEATKIPELASRVLEGPYARRVSENALRLLYFHCRAEVAPLVGPGADQVPDEAVGRLREIFRGRRPRRFELRDAELSGADLRGVDLCGAKLEAARLDGADLRDAVFRGAGLQGADLSFGRFARCDFTGADLRDCRTTGSGFLGAVGLAAELAVTAADKTGAPPCAPTLDGG